MNGWINFIGYQLTWLIVVSNAGRGHAWVGVVAACAFISLQLAGSTRRLLDLRLMAAALLLGVFVDGGLGLLGWLRYAAAEAALPSGGAPVWILALWMAFALTMRRSLAWLQGRPWFGMALGAIGAPLAYLGASRGWDAVRLTPPAYLAVMGLAVGWGLAVPAMLYVIRRNSPKSAGVVRIGAAGAQ